MGIRDLLIDILQSVDNCPYAYGLTYPNYKEHCGDVDSSSYVSCSACIVKCVDEYLKSTIKDGAWHLQLSFKNERLQIELYDLCHGDKCVAHSLTKEYGEMIVDAMNKKSVF